MSNEADLLPGTLDLLILKAVSLGPLYELTAQGRKRLARATGDWNRLVAAMGAVLRARPKEA